MPRDLNNYRKWLEIKGKDKVVTIDGKQYVIKVSVYKATYPYVAL
jgi:hypothetical protein